MSTLEKKAIMSLKVIKNISEEMKKMMTTIKLTNGTNTDEQFFDIKLDRIWVECNNILKEYELRGKRLGDKENLSKDHK